MAPPGNLWVKEPGSADVPGKCRRPYRVVALRGNISKMQGERVLFDGIRYFFC